MNPRLDELRQTDRNLPIPAISEAMELVKEAADAAGVSPTEYVKDWDADGQPLGGREIARAVVSHA